MKPEKKFQGRLFLICMLTLSLGTIIGCEKDDDNNPSGGSPGTNEVWMQNTAFTPASITVAVGTTITWTNKDNVTHTVTSNTGAFDSGNVGGGGTYSHQFTATGTFQYHCTPHPGMTATVVVQ